MFRTIRARIAVPYLVLSLVATIGLAAYFTGVMRHNYLADLQGQLSAEASLVAESVSPLIGQEMPDSAIEAETRRLGELLQARVTVIRPDGVVLGDSEEDPATMESHSNRPEIQQALAGQVGTNSRFSRTVGYRMMYVATPVRQGGGEPGAIVGVARVALPLTQIEQRIAQMRTTIALVALLALLLTGGVAMLIAERVARPVQKLTELAERMAGGDLAGRLRVESRDEVGRLAGAFNHMAGEIQSQIEALHDQGSTMAAVLAHMADGVLIVDGQGVVRLINAAGARLLDIDTSEAVGERFVALVRDHEIIDVWRRSVERQIEWSEAVEMDKRQPLLRVVATPLLDTRDRGSLVLLQDLSEMRRLETVRRDFISNISHELRTPIAALKALVETLRDGALDDPPAAERFLNRMEGEVDALAQMVQELLELSRIESGQAPLQLVPADVADLTIPAVERYRLQAERCGLDLEVRLPATGDLPQVRADAGRVREVIGNLVHNAIKFTPTGGRVTVSAESVGDEVVISVKDTGIGIPAADLPRVFERFFKADRARIRNGTGTGLGLSIARHIVQGHGGRIWVESVEGQGSTFYFSLPVVNKTITKP